MRVRQQPPPTAEKTIHVAHPRYSGVAKAAGVVCSASLDPVGQIGSVFEASPSLREVYNLCAVCVSRTPNVRTRNESRVCATSRARSHLPSPRAERPSSSSSTREKCYARAQAVLLKDLRNDTTLKTAAHPLPGRTVVQYTLCTVTIADPGWGRSWLCRSHRYRTSARPGDVCTT